jgi:nitrite reductase/ring-hydroxylating ferredoxin subunit
MATAARTELRTSFAAAELPPGTRRVVTLGRREIVVYNSSGVLYAVFNRCPHQRAPLDTLPLSGTALATDVVGDMRYGLEGCVVTCPWHHYEFDVRTGECLADPARFRIATYDVRREGEEIVVYNRRPPRS